MTKYAVAYISFFENDLQIKVVEADSWKQALAEAFGEDKLNSVACEATLEDAKVEAFNQAWLFSVEEIK